MRESAEQKFFNEQLVENSAQQVESSVEQSSSKQPVAEVSRDSIKTLGERLRGDLEVMQREIAEGLVNNVEKGPVLTAAQIERFEHKYAGEVQLTDNAIGSLEKVIVGLDVPSFFGDQRAVAEALNREEGKDAKNIELVILNSPKKQPADQALYERQISALSDRWGENSSQVIEMKDGPSVWVRDRFTIATDPDTGKGVVLIPKLNKMERLLKEKKVFFTGTDMGHELAEKLGYDTKEIGVYCEGGDMRAVGPYLFVGKETITKCFKGDKKYMVSELNSSYFEAGEVKVEVGFGMLEEAKTEFMRQTGMDARQANMHFYEYDSYELLEVEDNVYPLEGFSSSEVGEYVSAKYQEAKREVVIDKSLAPGEKLSDDQAINYIKPVYEKVIGRETHVVGQGIPEEQAIFHIDMFDTFIPDENAKPVIMVGDVKETVRVLDGLSEEQLREEAKTALKLANLAASTIATDLKERGALSQSDIRRFIILAEGNRMLRDMPGYLKALKGEASEEGPWDETTVAALEKKTKEFDACAKWFEERGFEVKRMPILPDVETMDFGKYTDPTHPKPEPRVMVRTYNNGLPEAVLDEEGRLQKTFTMPVYGLKSLDQAAVNNMNSIGVKVEAAPVGFLPTMQGLVNCTTSEIRGDFRKTAINESK